MSNTVFNALTNVAEFKELDFARCAHPCDLSGSAAIQSEVARRWRDTGSNVVEGYGLTELRQSSVSVVRAAPKLGTVGLPVPSTK